MHLTCIGEGPDGEALRRWAREHGLGGKVAFRGDMDYGDVLSVMADCDFLVLPSRAGEASPRVLIEAFLFGRPVVATEVGDSPRILGEGTNDLLVKPGDVEGLANALLRMASEPELRRSMGKSGLQYIKSLPSWESFSIQVRSLYIAAMAEGNAPAPAPVSHTNPGRG